MTTCRMIDLDFTTMQKPYIIPYQTAGFWFLMGLDAKQKNNNCFGKFKYLGQLSLGMEWIKGTITVEVFNITRNRLIQTGSTNYMTYDFETSQNLIWAVGDRCIVSQKLESEEHTNIHTSSEDNKYIWNHDNMHFTIEQIPQQHKKHTHNTFPKTWTRKNIQI